MVDEVFPMNEYTTLRIYGRGADIIKIVEII